MNKNTLVVVAIAVLVIGVGAFWALAGQESAMRYTNPMGSTNSGENAEPGSAVHDLPVEPAAASARADLAAKLGVSAKSIVIILVEEKTWNDGCLGLGGPAGAVLQALVDGFRVEMEVQGKTYVYRTDKEGNSVRME